MGCGCKKGNNSKPDLLPKEKIKLNLTGTLLKIPTALFFTVLMVILSPFLLIFVWYLVMMSVFNKESNVIDLMLKRFQKKPIKEVDDEEEFDFNPDDYELVNVDVIK